jgi:V/A-type H+-transporting ATPase subunit I
MANINDLLIFSVIFGIILMLSSYVYGIINYSRERNITEGLFGRNGLAGLSFYLILLFTIYWIFIAHQNLTPILIIIMIGILLLILFRVPLSSKLTHSDKFTRILSINDYIEEGFGIIETLISMLSNTISFLRVGAFALNHVGLYVAFLTLAQMIRTSGGKWSILILILGNIIILTLEALIVFIQALRLEYYELFTKYYRGDGKDYNPVKMNENMSY